MQLGYFSRLKNDSKRWIENGLIDEATAGAILADVESQKRGYSFTTIIIMLGVVCLCFAAMTFVAANWDEMPKYLRVLLLLSAMWAAYGAAVLARRRGSPIISDFLIMCGCAIFGATIMLVGQIYHLQGKAEDAVLLWAGGTLLATLILRSSAALWLAIGLFTLWFMLENDFEFGSRAKVNFLYPVFWAMCCAAAYWLKAQRSAHSLMWGMLLWLGVTVLIYTQLHDTIAYFLALYAGFYVLIGLSLLSLEKWQILRKFEASFIAYLIICAIGFTALWVGISSFDEKFFDQLQTLGAINYTPMIICLIVALGTFAYAWSKKMTSVYDLGFCAFWIAASLVATSTYGVQIPFIGEALSLGLAIWFIRMGDRQDIPSVVRLGYVAFGMVMLLIYFRTVGSLLDTTAFYLISGVLLVLGAIFVPRIFKLIRGNKEVTA
ncbi:MAG: DUF2157 domain-containing protein [Rhizobiaceae bacterium]|nr:DUF2157 domain-containing protein [Rhizobiaceae bacterium]